MNIDDLYKFVVRRDYQKSVFIDRMKQQNVSDDDIEKFISKYDQETSSYVDRVFLGSNKMIHCVR